MSDERKTRAYERMLERVGKESGNDTEERVEKAREKEVTLGELSIDEAEIISQYLRRDLKAVGAALNRGSHAFARWLDFDLDMLESEIWRALTSVADPTELAWLKLNEPEPSVYHTGEICGIGTLSCQNCEQRVHFTRPGPIPPCPRCHKTLFSRLPENPA